jgi:DNA-binding transcriptional ArsR family regulator
MRHVPGDADPIAEARRQLRALAIRNKLFPELKAAEPAWAMMLDLLVESSRGRSVSVQSACLASGAPASTALRHLTKLVEAGHIVRVLDPSDGRRCLVQLSSEAGGRLRQYLSRAGTG